MVQDGNNSLQDSPGKITKRITPIPSARVYISSVNICTNPSAVYSKNNSITNLYYTRNRGSVRPQSIQRHIRNKKLRALDVIVSICQNFRTDIAR